MFVFQTRHGRQNPSAQTFFVQRQAQSQPRTFPFASRQQSFGRFDVTYTPVGPAPAEGSLVVTMKVHFNFTEGFSLSEQDQYESNFEYQIETVWSDQHKLVLNDPNLDSHIANVEIRLVTVDNSADAHYEIFVANRPGDFRSNVTGSDVNLDPDDPTDNIEKHLTSTDRFFRVGNFNFDSAAVNPDVQQELDEITRFLNAQPSQVRQANHPNGSVTLIYTGRASSEGNRAYNERLAKQRVETVQQYISTAVPDLAALEMTSADGEKGTTTEAAFRRVDVNVDLPQTSERDTDQQNTAAHEAGHMFGLSDEYIEAEESRFQNDLNRHDSLVRNLVDAAAAEEMRVDNDNSIMSLGMDVLRGHYMPFVAALRRVTGNDKWTVE